MTPAGRAAGEPGIPGVAGRFFLPLDLKGPVRRAFDRLRPEMLIIAETELWPNLLSVARERGTRVVLVNARLSERSFRGYRRFRFFFRRVLGAVDLIFAQTERDAERFRELGARQPSVAGNLKFDGRPPQLGELPRLARRALGKARRGPVLVAGSTMAGEERLVLRAWDQVRQGYPAALLILAPRHPQRFEEVAQVLSGEGRRFLRRTSLDPAELEAQFADVEILLLNTIGELAGVFELADVAFVGGSLVPTGGHNVLEPAFWAKPVLFGPHMQNFRDIAERFLAEGAAFQVQNADELAARTLALFGTSRRGAQWETERGSSWRAGRARQRGSWKTSASGLKKGLPRRWVSAPSKPLPVEETPGDLSSASHRRTASPLCAGLRNPSRAVVRDGRTSACGSLSARLAPAAAPRSSGDFGRQSHRRRNRQDTTRPLDRGPAARARSAPGHPDPRLPA